MTRHYRDLVGWKFASTSHIWVMTRHQNRISALVSQTSFRGETGGDVSKCRLFSQAMARQADRLLSKEHGSTNKRGGLVTILVVGHSILAIS